MASFNSPYVFRSADDFHLDYDVSSEYLGKGGFGTVFPGTRKSDGRKVAIKRVPLWRLPSCWSITEGTPKIPKEVEILQLAQGCPGVIRLYDFWRDESDLVIVMEYNENAVDLLSYIVENRAFKESEAASILRQLIKTLLACQAKNIFHRDVKLENILFDKTTGEITLIDFGCGEVTSSPHQEFSEYLGTPDYVPPEYYFHHTYTAEAATVWSVGCIAFMMIFACKPFYSKKAVMLNRLRMDQGIGSMCCRMFIQNCLSPDSAERATLESLLSTSFLAENLPRITEPTATTEEEEDNEKVVRRSWRSERTISNKSEDKPSEEHNDMNLQPKQQQPSSIPPSTSATNELRIDILLKQICGEADGELRYIRNPATSTTAANPIGQNKITTDYKRPRDESIISTRLFQYKMMRKY